MFAILLIIFVISLVYFKLKSNYSYWRKRGVPGPEPTFLFGNLKESFLMRKSNFHVFEKIYNDYKNYPIVGIYRAFTPILMIRDPELIKDITVKSFRHFHDNTIEVDKNLDPIFGRNPFCLKGDEWKIVRAQLTPGMTSGKIKSVYPIIENTCTKLLNFLSANGSKCYEAKELCQKFTLENVATCAFGLEAQAFGNEKGEFQQIAEHLTLTSTFQALMFTLSVFFPSVTKIYPLKFFNKDAEIRLMNLVSETVKYRDENGINRQDYLEILRQLKHSSKDYQFTDVDVAAQAFTFFIDGYETSASAMSFILFELSLNPQVLEKLREEINGALEENDNKLPYEVLQHLPYLEAVINESLRLYPPLFALEKLCTQDYSYISKDPKIKSFIIEKGTIILLPLSGLHYDEEYFEDPTVFNPERFLKSENEKIPKYVYMPFGEGPRSCLGQRFALLQVKLAVANIVKTFDISLNPRTQLPLVFDPVIFLTTPKDGLWLDLKKLN